MAYILMYINYLQSQHILPVLQRKEACEKFLARGGELCKERVSKEMKISYKRLQNVEDLADLGL